MPTARDNWVIGLHQSQFESSLQTLTVIALVVVMDIVAQVWTSAVCEQRSVVCAWLELEKIVLGGNFEL
jgi:hypothetical protein